MINVTKSYLPPLSEYVYHLECIWQRCIMTNYGPLVQNLKKKLKEYLGAKHLFLVNNGTIALQMTINKYLL